MNEVSPGNERHTKVSDSKPWDITNDNTIPMENLYEKYQQSTQICTDSRNLTPGCLFVCLKGANFDGNKFAADVLAQGAKYVITENRELAGNPQAIVVDDALKTLQQLAHYHREQLKIPVIGITWAGMFAHEFHKKA